MGVYVHFGIGFGLLAFVLLLALAIFIYWQFRKSRGRPFVPQRLSRNIQVRPVVIQIPRFPRRPPPVARYSRNHQPSKSHRAPSRKRNTACRHHAGATQARRTCHECGRSKK